MDLTAEETEPELSEEEAQANKEKSESLKQQGNVVFKDGDYEKSIEIYSEALQICPKIYKNERAILHSNRAAAYKHIGERDTAIDDCTKAIELNPNYIKAYSRYVKSFFTSEHQILMLLLLNIQLIIFFRFVDVLPFTKRLTSWMNAWPITIKWSNWNHRILKLARMFYVCSRLSLNETKN